jgi:hypothetical protein
VIDYPIREKQLPFITLRQRTLFHRFDDNTLTSQMAEPSFLERNTKGD